MRKKSRVIEQRIEEIILIFIILLNIMDFFEILPGDLDYAKKIISWSALGYLLYKASLTRIFFNNKHKFVDFFLIVSYFFLIFKNIIAYGKLNLDDFYLFYGLHKFVLENAFVFEFYTFVIGAVGIILVALYAAFKIEIKKPSLVNIFYKEIIQSKKFIKNILKLLVIFFVFIGFFVVVFNLVMEWLATAVDAPILMLGIFFYLFVVMRHYRKFSIDSLIYKIGDVGEDFYGRFITLFHYKKTLFLGITGMLVLHLLTDIGNFIIPYVFVFHDVLYLEQLGAGHEALLLLFLEQIKNYAMLDKISLFFIYFLNLLALLFLLLVPAFLWYVMFKDKKMHINNFIVSLFFTSVTAFIFSPVFRIKGIFKKNLIGVDILTNYANNLLFENFYTILIFLIVVFVIIFLLSNYYKKFILGFGFLIGIVFFAIYTYIFFISSMNYYVKLLSSLLSSSQYFFLFYFFLFLTITIIFYVFGFLLFVDDVIKLRVFDKIL